MMQENYASKGVAGTGLGLGIAGTVLALLNNNGGGLNLGGLLGTGNQAALAGGVAAAFAEKDAKIAKLESQEYTKDAVLGLYRYVDGQFAVQSQQLAKLQCQTDQNTKVLESITKVVVPQAVVVTVPATTTTN